MAKLERTDKPVSILLDELSTGVLGLPEIQRGYIWERPKARDLIDSLYREYPSGLILLWKPKELPELRELAIEHGNTRTPESLILDGQQRLTSLKKVFDRSINVFFNLQDEAFQIYSSKLKSNPLWVSVTDVLIDGAVKVWKQLKKNVEDKSIRIEDGILEQYLDRLVQLEKIKEYRYPVMIIHTDDYEEITESFIRVNSRGTPLREAELAMAQLAFHWPGALANEFENALDNYEDISYEFEARFLMRCYVAISTGQNRFKFLGRLWKRSQQELEESWIKTKKALDHAVNFLKNNAGIESTDWIPSLNALIPIVYYLSKKEGRLSNEESNRLLCWFFEANIHGRFAGSPETKVDQDLKAIESEDPLTGLISNLMRDTPSLEITPEMIEGKYQRHPFMPIVFAMARRRGAKDWFTGTILSSTNVGAEHKLELHHIFPRGVLKETGTYGAYEIDDIANIAFLSQKANRSIQADNPLMYLAEIEEERLISQFEPLDRELWNIEYYDKFIAERRRLLTQSINEYLLELGKDYLTKAQEIMQRPHEIIPDLIHDHKREEINPSIIESQNRELIKPWLQNGENWHLYERCSNRTRELFLSLDKIIRGNTDANGPEFRQEDYISYKIDKVNWIYITTRKNMLYFHVKVRREFSNVDKVATDLNLLKFDANASQSDKKNLGSSVEIIGIDGNRDWILIRMKDDFNLDAETFSKFLKEARVAKTK